MTDGLTDAAKAEIAEAIRIIREDKFEGFVRSKFSSLTPPPKEEKKDELIEEKPTPPPVKEETKEEEKTSPKPVRKSSYWGEILED